MSDLSLYGYTEEMARQAQRMHKQALERLAAFNASLNPPAPPWANYLMHRWMEELHPTRNRELAWRICRKAWNLSVEHPRRYHEYKAGMRMLWRLRWPVFQGKLP